MKLAGQRIAVFGLGRSGLGVARAVLELGGHPTVFDEHAREALVKPDLARLAEGEHIELVFGWKGEIEPAAFAYMVTNPAVDPRHPTIRKVVQAGLPVLSEIEFAYRISVAPIVAITGTNGKSTTTVMTYLCLMACGEEPILCGNIFGSGYPEKSLTEAALSAPSNQILVAEVSSFQLDLVDGFRPISAAITNISDDHLDRYDSFADYAAAKRRIFAAQRSNDAAVLRSDESFEPTGPVVLRFGGTDSEARVDGNDLVVLGTRKSLEEMPFYEPHNALNAQTAALLTFGALRHKAIGSHSSEAAQLLRKAGANPEGSDGPAPEEIFSGLRRFRGLRHRMELVGEREGVIVINNSMCTNPIAVVSSLQAVGRSSHALIGGVNKETNFEPLRQYLLESRNRVYLFGRDASQIDAALGGGNPIVETMESAFGLAAKAARPGEAIILAPGCASMDQFRDFRERGDVFRTIAGEWLRS